jgi:hypothetical protein
MKKNMTIILGICLLAIACNSQEEATPETKGVPGTQVLLNYFPEKTLGSDTLAFFVNADAEFEKSEAFDMLLERVLPDTVFELVVFGVEEYAKHQPQFRFALDNKYDACILSSTEHWYFQTSMLLYNKETGYFTDMEVLAQFYGGDGGQIATESWVWGKQLYRKEAFRSISFDEEVDDVMEKTGEVAAMNTWTPKGYVGEPFVDSLALSEQFKMQWSWEDW